MPFTTSEPKLYYEVTGQGPPIIWSHGLLMDHEMFDDQVKEFSKTHTCITWDERAHGQTATKECPPFSYYDSASDVMRVLDELKIEKAILAGMSQGGYLSLRAALKYPQRVEGLILIDTQAHTDKIDTIELQEVYGRFTGAFKNGEHLDDELCQLIAGIIMDTTWPHTGYWIAKWKKYEPVNLLAAYNCLSTRDDIQPLIHNIKVPSIVIHGSNDRSIQVASAKIMNDALQNSEMIVVEGQNHAANMTAPKEVNEAIAKFLSKNFP